MDECQSKTHCDGNEPFGAPRTGEEHEREDNFVRFRTERSASTGGLLTLKS